MGLGNLLRRIWRFFHPQWTAMTPKQIKEIDRAVAESMAKGSFNTKHRPTAAPPTGDQLWTGTHADTSDIGRAMSDYSSSSYAGGGGSHYHHDEYFTTPPPLPLMPNEPPRLWSMSSRGGVSVSSSRGRDSGYAEQQQQQQYRPSSSATRKYTPSPQLYHRPSYYSIHSSSSHHQQQRHWGYEPEQQQPYYYDESPYQYAAATRPQYPPASYYPEGGYARAYVPPVGDDDGIVAGEPVNAPF